MDPGLTGAFSASDISDCLGLKLDPEGDEHDQDVHGA
jgi:hypothetical protein